MYVNRLKPFEQVANFRDFGGYHAADGKRVRWHKLYRSGHLGAMTEADKQRVLALNIGQVFDFRTDREVAMNPTQFASGHEPKLISLSVDPGDNLEFLEWLKSNPGEEELKQQIRSNYREINRLLAIDNADAYRTLFQHLLEEDAPVLIHCSAGKDRTGIGAALILSALEVPRQVVIDDYLLTNDYTDTHKMLAWYASFTQRELKPEIADILFNVQAEYLQSAFDAIDQAFGSFQRYAQDAMGLDAEALQALKERYLED